MEDIEYKKSKAISMAVQRFNLNLVPQVVVQKIDRLETEYYEIDDMKCGCDLNVTSTIKVSCKHKESNQIFKVCFNHPNEHISDSMGISIGQKIHNLYSIPVYVLKRNDKIEFFIGKQTTIANMILNFPSNHSKLLKKF